MMIKKNRRAKKRGGEERSTAMQGRNRIMMQDSDFSVSMEIIGEITSSLLLSWRLDEDWILLDRIGYDWIVLDRIE